MGKWTHLGDWVDVADAERLIMEAIARAKSHAG
jgi:inorganic pyrophosphatase